MLYSQKEVDTLLEEQVNKLLKEIVNNNSKCKSCNFYHPEMDSGTCFIAFACLQQDFKGYKKKK